ncbi:MAG: energy transducer TonB, partial [Brevundimonas sp.]
PAPREQAPEPELVVGVAPISSATPGMGQGGEGTGSGTGIGAGDGPGRGVRTGPRNLRQPAPLALRRYHPPEALRRGVSGTAVVSCRIREDTVLDQCRVLSETPPGQGFGAAGIAAAVAEYRFRPGMIDGRPDYDLRAVITVRFGRNAP